MRVLALGTAAAWAAASLLQKRAVSAGARPEAMLASYATVFAVAAWVVLLAVRRGRVGTPIADAGGATSVLAVGVVGFATAYGLLFRAMCRGDLHRLIALAYVTPAFVLVGAWAFLGERPSPRSLVGLALVVAGGLLV